MIPIVENIPRVLPDNSMAVIDVNSWERPAVFNWLQEQGNVDEHEMHRTFNCGIGMVIVVPADEAENAMDILRASGEDAFIIGEIAHSEDDQEQIDLVGLAE